MAKKRSVTKVEIGVGDQALTENHLREGPFLVMVAELAESSKGTWLKVTREDGYQAVIRKSENGYELLMGSDLY